MIRGLRVWIAMSLAVFATTAELSGDLAVDIGNADGQVTPITVVAGNQVFVPFIATPDLTTILSGYNFAVEFGPSGDGNGNGFGLGGNFDRTDFSVSQILGGFSGTLFITPDSAGPVFYDDTPGVSTNYDFLVNHNGSTQTFEPGDGSFGLFNLVIDVPVNATPGIYDVRLELNDTPGGDNSNAPGGVPVTVNQGSIQVVTIPEPASGSLLVLCGMVSATARRRKPGC